MNTRRGWLAGLCAAGLIACTFAPIPALADGNQPITRNTFRDVSKKVSPAVVNIKIKSNIVFGAQGRSKMMLPPNFGLDDEMREYLERLFEQQAPNMTPQDQEGLKYARSASGVIVSADGYVVTSHHVVASVDEKDIEVCLPDGRIFDKVKVIGNDELTDLAVLKVEGKDLPFMQWGDSDKIEVGDFVVAVGNPLEFNNSVSEGIVSAKHRVINKAQIEDLIQTTAMINPGNSGGALVDLDGSLIGINMAIATNSGMWSGLGFAIPSKIAQDVTEQLIAKGKVARGYLGIEMAPMTNTLARELGYEGSEGIVVKGVRPGGAAEKAGIQRYDIIAKVNDKPIKELNDMHRNIATRKVGESVDLEVYRGEGSEKPSKKLVKVILDERPSPEDLQQEPGKRMLKPKSSEPAPKDLAGLAVSPAPDGKGVVVDAVAPGSRAAKADIQKGDVILEVNKQKVQDSAQVQKALEGRSSDSHLLYVERNGQSAFVSIPAE